VGPLRIVDLDLPPDVSAVVMATGIVAVAAQDHGYRHIDLALGALASLGFVLLTAGLGLRIAARLSTVAAQARDPDVALRMFTFVAAAAVLGVRWFENPAVVTLLGVLGTLGWLVLVPLAVRDVRSRPRAELRDHVHGAWLLPSVATAGLATTAADLAVIDHAAALDVVGALLWLGAIGIYVAVTWLVAWRSLAGPFGPDDVTPDSWILMGALAISALAGAHVLAASDALASLAWLADAMRPATLVVWVAASLWIPALLYAEVWRVDRRAGSLHFQGVWWSAVFPLGMYAAATAATGTELHMHALRTISLVFFWVAATVWSLVAVGLVHYALAGRRAATR
jgi:tellurite resistance protein TehA-like permease